MYHRKLPNIHHIQGLSMKRLYDKHLFKTTKDRFLWTRIDVVTAVEGIHD